VVALDISRLQCPDGDTGDRLADVVEQASADHAHARQREIDLVSGFLLCDFQRPALFAGSALAVGEREIPTARHMQRVTARSDVAELIPSVGRGALGPPIAQVIGLGRETNLRAPQRLARVQASDAAADHTADLGLLRRVAACRLGRSRRNLDVGPSDACGDRDGQRQCDHHWYAPV
jgi:hypothetical protein